MEPSCGHRLWNSRKHRLDFFPSIGLPSWQLPPASPPPQRVDSRLRWEYCPCISTFGELLPRLLYAIQTCPSSTGLDNHTLYDTLCPIGAPPQLDTGSHDTNKHRPHEDCRPCPPFYGCQGQLLWTPQVLKTQSNQYIHQRLGHERRRGVRLRGR